MENRTDLAVESFESAEKTVIDGVKITQEDAVTTVDVLNESGAKALGKPVGKYITCNASLDNSSPEDFDSSLDTLCPILSKMLPDDIKSVLVVGLGNTDITADALGPKAVDNVFSTRHLISNNDLFAGFFNVASLCTGVLADTGIESAEIVASVAEQIKPDCVITIDALAASSTDRLGTTVQLSDTGISPGSGVGNHRYEISKSTLGVPVLSVGIPTVVSTQIISGKEVDEPMLVTPGEIDRIIETGARLIGMTVNCCFQKNLSRRELYSLIG